MVDATVLLLLVALGVLLIWVECKYGGKQHGSHGGGKPPGWQRRRKT